MKKCFRADNHTLACIIVPVNGFGSASFMYIAMHIAGTSYSGHWDGPQASFCYSTGVVGIHAALWQHIAFELFYEPFFESKWIDKIKAQQN